MVKIKEIVEDIGEVLDPEEEAEDVEGGIFDEDIGGDDEEAPVGGIFDEDFDETDEEAPASDFDIGSTMLTSAAPVESWAGQNLEDTLSKDWIKKDWDGEEDAFTGDFYKSSDERKDVYGASNDVYSSGRGGGVYNESSGGYDAGKGGAYDVKGADVGGLKSHEQVKDERRGSRSSLESGFADARNRENREFNKDAIVYEAKDAA